MINGVIALKTGETLAITDESLVANGLLVKYSTCGADFCIGTFNAAEMQIKIYDDNSVGREFDGASISLTYTQDIEQGEGEEPVQPIVAPLGVFIVDGEKTERTKNIVKLTAYDRALLFDEDLPESVRTGNYTALEAFTLCCEAVGVGIGIDSTEGLPNSEVSFGVTSKSIQTYRDLVMWAAQLLCCNAMMSRDGKLIIRPARYSSPGGSIAADYTISGEDRMSITFSDTQIYIKYLASYSGGKNKSYKSELEPWDEHVRTGAYNAFKNPLLDSLSETDCDSANTAWLEYITGFGTRRIKAKLFDRPDIVPGDAVFFRGGSIDLGRKIIGVVSTVNWKYRGGTTVICAAPSVARESEVKDEA